MSYKLHISLTALQDNICTPLDEISTSVINYWLGKQYELWTALFPDRTSTAKR